MARALRRVSTERGIDRSRLALVAFGGAGSCSAAVFDPVGEMVAQAEHTWPPPRVGMTIWGPIPALDGEPATTSGAEGGIRLLLGQPARGAGDLG